MSKAVELSMPCLVLAAGRAHTHLLAAVVNDWGHVKREIGRLKQASSHAVRNAVPGKVWGAGGKPIRIKDRAHQRRVFRYILDHEQEGAWVWRFDGEIGERDDPGLRCAQARLLEQFLKSRGSRS